LIFDTFFNVKGFKGVEKFGVKITIISPKQLLEEIKWEL